MGPPSGADRPPTLPASDATALTQAVPWGDWTLPTRKLAFRVNGSLSVASWSAASAKGTAALGELGLQFAHDLKPRFEGASVWGPMAVLGYGYLVGEAGLRLTSDSAFYGPTFSSFVATIQFWVDPPLPRGTRDRPDIPHGWKVSVGAGQVQSTNRHARGAGDYRGFHQLDPTDPALGWVPGVILERLG